MAERIRILIVDDHPAIRKGLIATLEPEPDMEIVGSAATRQQAFEIWEKTRQEPFTIRAVVGKSTETVITALEGATA